MSSDYNSSYVRFNTYTKKYDGFVGEKLVTTQSTHLKALEKMTKYVKGQQ